MSGWNRPAAPCVTQPTGEVVEIQVASRDITERKLAEETLQALSQERAQQAEAAEALAEATAALATALEPEHLHEIILQQMARVVPCDTAHIFEYRDGSVIAVGGVGESRLPAGVRVSRARGRSRAVPPSRRTGRLLSETREAPGWRNIPPWTGAHEIRSTCSCRCSCTANSMAACEWAAAARASISRRTFRWPVPLRERIAQALWNARLYQLEQRRARAAEQLAACAATLWLP